MAGRVALITGAGRGIGLSAAKLFLQNNYRVFVSDLNLDKARQELQSTPSDRIGFLETDVTKEDQVEAMTQAALKQFGQVDAAICNAGILSPIVPWLDYIDKMLSVNVKAMRASPSTGKGCSLTFVASVASLYAYCASKWAVRGLSLTAAAEFAPYGIRSNCIQPGATATEMFASFPPELQTAVKDPLEIAQVMLFLAGEQSSFMNGSTVAVHGGQTPT
ncbi:hypothetical protein Rhopal_001203-T1 [Rhodotorula paludigena]|uniref:Uncharacterized protein n=1 Tax=Rhodotorula paludigena TaxID=86838 RepID=A0AAV5GHY8_9BASI|nr:hypothetical protein Rhopal_001203-T1 [Rhodotorula paludigena]